jgi:thioredoxin reductase (NADPH)
MDGSEGVYGADALVVATGGFDRPNLLNVPGEDLPKVLHYYKEPYPFYGQDVLVVGAGNSAVESALEMYRNGARVTMVHFLDTIDRGVKPWVVPGIAWSGSSRRRWCSSTWTRMRPSRSRTISWWP